MIICNTRNLSAPLTGVQRYTRELLLRIPDIVQISPYFAPRSIGGHIWEQSILPLHTRRSLLWSPANTGPLAVRRQVVTVHDLATLDCPEGFSPRFTAYYNWLLPRLLPKVASILTVSEFTRGRIAERFHIAPERIHVTPLAVDHSHFYPRPKTDIANVSRLLNLPQRYVLFLGALSERKNIRTLLAAWQEAKIDDDIYLVIAGGAGMSHVFGKTEFSSLPARTIFLDRIESEWLPPLLSGAIAFVFPSLYEGFGLPPLEAMACGTPCLVSCAAALPEVVADAALTFSPTDIPTLATALSNVISSESLQQKLREKGITRARQFKWDHTAKLTRSVLEAY